MPKGQKHHYIPIFYLKQWCGPDRRLCEYSRPWKEMMVQRKYPSATGFEHGLYTLTAFPSETAEIVERKFMQAMDSNAARALQYLLRQDIKSLNAELRTAWAVFIISLMRRTPESFRHLQEGLRASFVENDVPLPTGDPTTDKESRARLAIFERENAMLLQNLITSNRIGTHIINMRWSVARFAGAQYPFLTSDRPFVMTNGIGHDHSHIAVPISPTHVFLATNTLEQEKSLHTISPQSFMHQVNDRMASQARKFVYGTDDSQRRFVEKRFGRRHPSAPGETP